MQVIRLTRSKCPYPTYPELFITSVQLYNSDAICPTDQAYLKAGQCSPPERSAADLITHCRPHTHLQPG